MESVLVSPFISFRLYSLAVYSDFERWKDIRADWLPKWPEPLSVGGPQKKKENNQKGPSVLSLWQINWLIDCSKLSLYERRTRGLLRQIDLRLLYPFVLPRQSAVWYFLWFIYLFIFCSILILDKSINCFIQQTQ